MTELYATGPIGPMNFSWNVKLGFFDSIKYILNSNSQKLIYTKYSIQNLLSSITCFSENLRIPNLNIVLNHYNIEILNNSDYHESITDVICNFLNNYGNKVITIYDKHMLSENKYVYTFITINTNKINFYHNFIFTNKKELNYIRYQI